MPLVMAHFIRGVCGAGVWPGGGSTAHSNMAALWQAPLGLLRQPTFPRGLSLPTVCPYASPSSKCDK